MAFYRSFQQHYERQRQSRRRAGIIRQLLIATANRTQSNSVAIERLTERMDQLTGRVDQLAITQQNASLDQLTALTLRSFENAEAERVIIRELQAEVRFLQAENHQILEYLFGQRNGNGDSLQT